MERLEKIFYFIKRQFKKYNDIFSQYIFRQIMYDDRKLTTEVSFYFN